MCTESVAVPLFCPASIYEATVARFKLLFQRLSRDVEQNYKKSQPVLVAIKYRSEGWTGHITCELGGGGE
jgi:hypothetical protein